MNQTEKLTAEEDHQANLFELVGECQRPLSGKSGQVAEVIVSFFRFSAQVIAVMVSSFRFSVQYHYLKSQENGI